MADVQQNQDFSTVLLVQWPLDDAIEWICDNMKPEDVFAERDLIDWAEENGYVKCDGC